MGYKKGHYKGYFQRYLDLEGPVFLGLLFMIAHCLISSL